MSDGAIGYLFHNPDTGMEFSRNHPIDSGECPDAENVRSATAEALLEALTAAWGDHQLETRELRASVNRLVEERNATAKLLADPNAVHVNMLRGVIAKPAPNQIRHVYGDTLCDGEGRRNGQPPQPMPWQRAELAGWSIVGMNHYHQGGQKHLFVSMARNGRCITAEGADATRVWDDLATKARDVKAEEMREINDGR